MEEMVASQLRPMIDGSPTVPMKQAGLKAIDEMISMLPKDDLQQVMDELDASVTERKDTETVDSLRSCAGKECCDLQAWLETKPSLTC